MSLQVWLPLINDTNNQGLCGDVLTTSGITFADGGKLGSKYFSGGTITIPASISKNIFNNNNMSFAFWLYPMSSGTNIIMGQNPMSAGNNRMYSIFQYSSINDLHLSWQDETSSSTTFLGGLWNGFFTADTWTHCCITYDGSKAVIYRNGEQYSTANGTSKRAVFEYDYPIVGSAIRRLNDVRIYNHCLSPKEVKELSKGLVLHYPLTRTQDLIFEDMVAIKDEDSNNLIEETSGDAILEEYSSDWEDSFLNIEYDVSGYQRNGINYGTTYSSDTVRYLTCTSFNGITDGVVISNLDISNILNDQCTISFWIKPDGENGARSVYFSAYNSTSWSIEKNTSNKLRLYWNGNPDISTTLSISDGEWQHIVITKNGTSDVKVYLNGELIQSLTNTHSNLTFGTTWRLGRDTRSNEGTPYKGLMSDFRIYSTALDADDILALYNTPASITSNGTLLTQGEISEV